jgi:superfamily II DNA or RNA helicase
MQDDISDLKKSHGEYTDETLFNHFNKPKRYAGVIEKWKEKANGLKTIVFCVNVKHAEETAIAFNEAGIMADCVTGKTKKADRVRILNAHKGGFFPVLVNCGVLTTGYDDQSLMCVVVDRATLSLTLWLQMTGRGGRALEGKKEFIILDFGLNHDRFGRWDSAREWKLEPPKKKSKLEQAAPVKICPQCEAMLFASARKCEYCGYVYPEGSKEPAEGIMVEVPKHVPDELKGRYVSSLRLVELYKLQKAGRFKASFCWRVVRSRVLIYKKAIGLDKHNLFLRIKETKPIITGGSLLKTGERVVYTYAKLAGYSRGWAYRQSKDVENFGFKDYKLK